MNTNITVSVLISSALVVGSLYLITGDSPTMASDTGKGATSNIEIRDGVQYVTVSARGGYVPRTSVIQPDIPTKLIVKTDGTYDCSASLVIRDVDFQKILEPNGEEIIDLGIPKSGGSIQGVCGMGMYSFTIESK